MMLMRKLDVFVAALLVIGGINWGLIGFFDFNLVSWILGEMGSRIVYAVVGLSALYQAFQWKAIARRWNCVLPGMAESPAR